MKNLIFLFLISILPGCMTVDRIQRNCDLFSQICVTSTNTEVHWRDTTILLAPIAARLPESNIVINTTLKIVNGKINMPKTIKQNGLITTEVTVTNNQLFIHSYLNDSTILVKPEPVVIHDAIRDEKTTKYITLPRERYIPIIFKITFWIVIFGIAAGAIYLLISKGTIGKLFQLLRKI